MHIVSPLCFRPYLNRFNNYFFLSIYKDELFNFCVHLIIALMSLTTMSARDTDFSNSHAYSRDSFVVKISESHGSWDAMIHFVANTRT